MAHRLQVLAIVAGLLAASVLVVAALPGPLAPVMPNGPSAAPSVGIVKASALTPYIWYNYTDFFNVPYGEWWDLRTKQYATDYPIGADCFSQTGYNDGTCTTRVTGLPNVAHYPYENWLGPAGSATIFAPYRAAIHAYDEGAYNISEPVFLPILNYGAAPGSKLQFNWNMQYLTVADGNALTTAGCPGVNPAKSFFDGYKLRSVIYLTMDAQEAARMFGAPQSTNPTTLNTWWNGEVTSSCGTNGALETDLTNWFTTTEGNGKYDVYNGFAGAYTTFYTNVSYKIDADGTTHVVIDHTAWGTEVLMDRWFYWGNTSYATNALDSTKRTGWWGMENGWWEGVHFNGNLTAAALDFNLNGVLQYHFQERSNPGPDNAFRSAANPSDSDDVPVWTWGPQLVDYATGLPQSTKHPWELNRYTGTNYIKSTPGSGDYGTNTSFDYVPVSWSAPAWEWWNFVFPTNSSAYYQNPNTATLGTALPGTQLPPAASATLSFLNIFPSTYGTWTAASGTWYVAGGTAVSWPAGNAGHYPYYPYPGIFFAAPPGPPVVATTGATSITTTGATLGGNLASLGAASSVTVGFVYSTSPLLSSPQNVTVGSRATTGAFTTTVSTLTPATTYYFEAWGLGQGFAHGAVVQFSTLGTPPVVVTDAAGTVTASGAILNGHTTSLGTATTITVGFIYSTSSSLTSPLNVTFGTQTATGAFASTVTSLASGTTYYFEAWANGDGFAHGAPLSFTTATVVGAPQVTTSAPTGVSTTAATMNGDLTNLGTATSVEVGFRYGTSLPLTTGTNTSVGTVTAIGTFIKALASLTPGTTYYYQAWANGNGFTLGVVESFTTLVTPPAVVTDGVTGLTTTTATLNGHTTSLGTATSVDVGFLWGTSNTLAGATNVTSGTQAAAAAFSSALTTVVYGTQYYYQAWANGQGFAAGAIMSFTVPVPTSPPTVATNAASGVTTAAATLNGATSNLGTASTVTVGFLWGTSNTLAGAANVTATTQTTAGAFTSALPGLASGTTYYFEAWANGDGFAEGAITSFMTAVTPPTVATSTASSITQTGATLNGVTSALGTATSVTVGFLWGTSNTLASATNVTATTQTTAGAFTSALASLTAGTTYYFQAWANGDGFAAGTIGSFTTTSPTAVTPPTVTTSAESGVSSSGATLNGNLAALGTASSVTVGFLWGTDAALSGATNVSLSAALTATGSFTTALTGLSPGTTYYFEAWGNGQGFAHGAIRSFTTPAATPPPENTFLGMPATIGYAVLAVIIIAIVVVVALLLMRRRKPAPPPPPENP